ncbi:class I SAM-dependent methyltransferase [Thermanaerothrix sp.]|uniref:class I SAM-dependent methyltransferase n=1 Tax=Thermanaerothrix sp. TaxID=2972675 RepID=UPI003C7AD8BB
MGDINNQHPADSSVYNKEYFLSECDGYEEFIAHKGKVLPKRLALSLERARVKPGMRVLDVGCGRGETLIWLAHQGVKAWGIDFSKDALLLAVDALQSSDLKSKCCCAFIAANACYLPLPDESFDLVLFLDVAEHLYPWELDQALSDIWRVLTPNGRLIIHTAPNLWYYKLGYPIYRFFERLRGVYLPKDPRDRFRYHRQVHVNEQSPASLARVLRNAGFQPRVWVADVQQRWKHRGFLTSIIGWIVTHIYPIKWIFCGDIFGEAKKVNRCEP